MDCPYRGDPLIKVLKCSGDDQGVEFQPINLKDIFDELSASVEGSARIATGVDVIGKFQYETRDKKDIVKKYESLEVINDNITSPRMQKVKDLVKKYEAS